MKHMGLFEGIGGFSLAARWAGWLTPVMVEWNPYCQAVLKKNFPDATIFGDIHQFDGWPYAGQIDCITGGFPCQPYSHAGKRKGNDDDRALWPQMLRVIREVAPEWVVGENVAGILSMDGGRVLAGILADLENAGYLPEVYFIPAIGVGAPHERYRVWIVAHRDTRNGTVSEQPPGGRYEGKNADIAGKDCGTVTHNSSIGRQWRADNERQGPTSGIGIGFDDSRAPADTGRRNGQDRRHGEQQGEIRKADEYRDGAIRCTWTEYWHEVATRVCRVDDGLPAGVDGTGSIPAKAKTKKAAGKSHRLEGLGNAIVPEIAYQIFEAINEFET